MSVYDEPVVYQALCGRCRGLAQRAPNRESRFTVYQCLAGCGECLGWSCGLREIFTCTGECVEWYPRDSKVGKMLMRGELVEVDVAVFSRGVGDFGPGAVQRDRDPRADDAKGYR